MDYKPAVLREPIEQGQDEDPRAVLRSHPNFPGTLSPEVEGTMVHMNPAWPWETVRLILREKLDPSCHALPKDSLEEAGRSFRTEMRDGHPASVVYVKPGPEPANVQA